jgi:hypothetical protein
MPGSGPECATAGIVAGTLPEIAVWDLRGPLSSRYGRQALGAQTLFLSGFTSRRDLPSALTEVAILQAGDDGRPDSVRCWSLLDTEQVRPFPEAFKEVGLIRDGHDIAIGQPEVVAYADILSMAYYTSAAAFRKSARTDLTYAQIFSEPRKYRGEVVNIAGRLKRLSRLEPPPEAQAQGVSDLYEAWIFNDVYGLNPFCALFTYLAPGMSDLVGEGKIKSQVEVSFDGYFYKKFRYKAADSREKTARDAPVFIGHTLVLRSRPAEAAGPADDWGNQIIGVFIGVVTLGVVAVVGLTWWFRRSDARVRRRLQASRNVDFIPPPADTPSEEFFKPAR